MEGDFFPFLSIFYTEDNTLHTFPNKLPHNVTYKDVRKQLCNWKEIAVEKAKEKNKNAITFLQDGNYDVLMSYYKRKLPLSLFLLFDSDNKTVLAACLYQPGTVHTDDKYYVNIATFIVNPIFYGMGVGTLFFRYLCNQEKKLHICHGFILLSEDSAFEFWTKMGFIKWNPPSQITIAIDKVTSMKYDF